jgi:L-alanine-DL-glutamate epimerase-like enolase superfamily enzyme
MSGIDQALWDIAGKAMGWPVFKLLGGKVREKVRCYIRSGPEFFGIPIEEAAQLTLEMGFDAFKSGHNPTPVPYNGRKHVDTVVGRNSAFCARSWGRMWPSWSISEGHFIRKMRTPW